ncbi:4-(cytidine 5'-diphospho)-2-C-methyl-D-erythritol kinase [Ensifer soli]|uniref:4-(cytidine 5'-diphospho)-2-C-methyl-D-erythritol kinase n=1 Tax=Ciceribacter sp. sgz301302 TaxID=3342379 RepID=UPI0035B72F34
MTASSAAFVRHHAPAKVNLALHVVGQRADGHHLLESIVAFADIGDTIDVAPAPQDGFSVDGPFAAGLPLTADAPGGNLVLRARDLLRGAFERRGWPAPPVAISLHKALPVASGIGGGSADAAATLRALTALWGGMPDVASLDAIALSLGADVPMCLQGRPLLARGIGERIELLDAFPTLPLVLVNPLVGVATPAVFRALRRKENPPLPLSPADGTAIAWRSALGPLRNDLQPPAIDTEPRIGAVLAALDATGAEIVRMSGSGATCFGLYADETAAARAADSLSQRHPGWYVRACRTLATAAGGDTPASPDVGQALAV